MRFRPIALLLTLALGLLAAALPADAEKAGKVYKVGYLAGHGRHYGAYLLKAFRQRLPLFEALRVPKYVERTEQLAKELGTSLSEEPRR